MSLADLPIDNIAHIQSYLTSAVMTFDTTIFGICKALRARAKAHVWPVFYTRELKYNHLAIITLFKFKRIYVYDSTRALGILKQLKPDTEVSLLRVGNSFMHDDKYVQYCDDDERPIVVTKPMKIVAVGHTINITASAPYELTVLPINRNVSNVYISGTLPTVLKLGGVENSPYCNSGGSAVYVDILHEDYLIGRYKIPPKMSMSVTGLVRYVDIPRKYYNMYPMIDKKYILDILNDEFDYHNDDLDRIAAHVCGKSQLRIRADVDVDDIMSVLHERLVHSIGAAGFIGAAGSK